VAYEVILTKAAERELRALPANILERVDRRIHDLATDPRPPGTKKLKGSHNQWRIRVGNFRVIYEIQDKVLLVLVLRVSDRKDAYG
jgi:mRNA interferase RelE/StbE